MHTLGYGQFREKRLSAAQARYLRAIETLVRVRRLLALAPVSTVTLNVAAQQASVAIR